MDERGVHERAERSGAASGVARRTGRLLVMGGAEDPDPDRMRLLPELVKLAGGIEARVMVCSAPAEDDRQKIEAYTPLLERLGVEEVIPAPITRRGEADEPRLLEALERATAVFFTGGDQLRLTALFAGTDLCERMRERIYEEGLVVSGTSAGAAAMSSVMIVGGPENGTVRRSDVDLAPGLGYWRDALIDTHFNQRGRVHRLLAVFAQNPQVIGIGIDENTAIDVVPGDTLRVIGAGCVMVMDGRVSHTNAPDAAFDDALALTDTTVHVLSDGYGFDLRAHRPLLPDGTEIRRR
jgi:cyanophycinase